MTDHHLEIFVAPEPEGATPLRPDPDHGCTCSVMEGRCNRHSAMMATIHEAWDTDAAKATLIRSLADGYGYPGSMVDLDTWDWSGVRDSTEATVETIYERLTA